MKQLLRLISISLVFLVLLTSCAKPAIDDVSNSSSIDEINNSSVDEALSKPTVSDSVSSVEYTGDELLDQLMNGDLSNVKFVEYYDEEVCKKYCEGAKKGDPNSIKFDINDDGVDELVLSSDQTLYNGINLITTIFSIENGMVTCRYIDEIEMGRGAFISKSGKLMDNYYFYGTCDYDSYTNWKFDKDWKFEKITSLELYYFYSMEELPDDWIQENPQMSKDGVYRFIIHYEKNENGEIIEKKEKISQKEFEKAFEEMMGVPFSQMAPEWYEYSQMNYDKENGRWY